MFLRHLIIHSHYSPLNSNCSIALLKNSVQKQACDSRQDFTKAWKSENFSTAVQVIVYTFQYNISLFHNTGSCSAYILLWLPNSLPKNFYLRHFTYINHINYLYITTPPCIYPFEWHRNYSLFLGGIILKYNPAVRCYTSPRLVPYVSSISIQLN